MVKTHVANALVLVLLSMAIVSSAQSDETVAFFLKNGNIIYGKLIETDNTGNIKVANDCGVYNIKATEIDSISKRHQVINIKEQSVVTVNQSTNTSTDKTVKKGYYNLTSVGLLLGQAQDGFVPVPSLTTVNGWRFSNSLYTGIGLGFEYYDWSVLPIFIDVRYIHGSGQVVPFGSFKIGYGFPIEKPSDSQNDYYDSKTKYFGGVQLNPEVGIQLKVGTTALLVSLGYHFQQLSYNETTYNWWNSNPVEKKVNTDYNRVSLRIGFIF